MSAELQTIPTTDATVPEMSEAELQAALSPFYVAVFRGAMRLYARAQAEGRLPELLAGTYHRTTTHKAPTAVTVSASTKS